MERIQQKMIKAIQKLLVKDSLDAFLVSSSLNVRYLTGFEGTAGLLMIFSDKAFLLADSRYASKAGRETKGVGIVKVNNYFEGLSVLMSRRKPCTTWGAGLRIGFEEEHLSCQKFRKLRLMLPGVRFYPYTGVVEKQRACKNKSEIYLIKKSIAITEKALTDTADFIRPGISEKDVADRLEENLRREGARGSNFRTMAAIPGNASLPHSEPGKKKIPSRGLVLVDVGCDYQGYNSDLTRLFLLGKMNSFEKRIVGIVAASQNKAIRAVRPGRKAKEIDCAGRGVIEKRGYGKYFGHALGHGIGLGVHEEPVISGESKTILKEGMVFTIEPGIYLPGRMGVRLEDIVLVTKKGAIVLTALPPVLGCSKK
jgi:Xaa-Pro aminopeptidase